MTDFPAKRGTATELILHYIAYQFILLEDI